MFPDRARWGRDSVSEYCLHLGTASILAAYFGCRAIAIDLSYETARM
jgi:hypothetical protein